MFPNKEDTGGLRVPVVSFTGRAHSDKTFPDAIGLRGEIALRAAGTLRKRWLGQ